MSSVFWARTNFFRVRKSKREEFGAWARKMSLTLATSGTDQRPSYCLMAGAGDGWPAYDPTGEDRGEESSAFKHQISRFLAPGSVAVMIEAGCEGMAYVGGHAIAVDHRGNTVSLSLQDGIMDKASRKWPKSKITRPSYGG